MNLNPNFINATIISSPNKVYIEDRKVIVNNQENNFDLFEKNERNDEIIKPIPVILQSKDSLVRSVMDKINNSQVNQMIKVEDGKYMEKNENLMSYSVKEEVKIESILGEKDELCMPYFLTREWVVKNFNLKK